MEKSAPPPRRKHQNHTLTRFLPRCSIILSPNRQLPTNYHIIITSYINTKDLNGTILVSRLIWQEQDRKPPSKATQLISGPVARSFSTQPMNCLQTTAHTFTQEPNQTIDRIKSWSRGLKHEMYSKYRIFRFPTIFWVRRDRILDTHNEFPSNHHIKLPPWAK